MINQTVSKLLEAKGPQIVILQRTRAVCDLEDQFGIHEVSAQPGVFTQT